MFTITDILKLIKLALSGFGLTLSVIALIDKLLKVPNDPNVSDIWSYISFGAGFLTLFFMARTLYMLGEQKREYYFSGHKKATISEAFGHGFLLLNIVCIELFIYSWNPNALSGW